MNKPAEYKEVNDGSPPNFAIDPEDRQRAFQVIEGDPIVLNVEVYNTGRWSKGVAVYVVGEAVGNNYVAPGTVYVECEAFFDPLEADLGWGRMGDGIMFEARAWEKPPGGGPPRSIIPSGLQIKPPFDYRDRLRRRKAWRVWGSRRLDLEIMLDAASPGRSQLEIWVVPPENPNGSQIISVELDILPEPEGEGMEGDLW